jgi:hypothetical protein
MVTTYILIRFDIIFMIYINFNDDYFVKNIILNDDTFLFI